MQLNALIVQALADHADLAFTGCSSSSREDNGAVPVANVRLTGAPNRPNVGERPTPLRALPIWHTRLENLDVNFELTVIKRQRLVVRG